MAYSDMGRMEDAREANRKAVAAAERHLELHPDDARALYLGAASMQKMGEEVQAFEW
ncbi:MAG: hypothetical protein GWM87_02540, partial [Xanthomonadales bacterium]|nr:hypothetical protein [Xanthomonadales bacterium]NIX11939.1 hypothetical protein [Xanthomonadales bacterium]